MNNVSHRVIHANLFRLTRFTGRLEVIAVDFDRFFKNLIPVQTFGSENGGGHAEVGHGDPV